MCTFPDAFWLLSKNVALKINDKRKLWKESGIIDYELFLYSNKRQKIVSSSRKIKWNEYTTKYFAFKTFFQWNIFLNMLPKIV